jgi:hypothetical protein
MQWLLGRGLLIASLCFFSGLLSESAGSAVSPPGAPTDVTATAGIGQGTVTFLVPATDGGSPITSCTVTANPGNISVTRSTTPFSPIAVTGWGHWARH